MLDLVRDAPPPAASVAGFGCGTGRSTLLPTARTRAVVAAPVFVDRLRAEAERLNLADRLRPEVGDVASPTFEPDSLDLVWSEGAAHALGSGAALHARRPLHRAGGRCIVSECEWLSENPPAEVAASWREPPRDGDGSIDTLRAERARGPAGFGYAFDALRRA